MVSDSESVHMYSGSISHQNLAYTLRDSTVRHAQSMNLKVAHTVNRNAASRPAEDRPAAQACQERPIQRSNLRTNRTLPAPAPCSHATEHALTSFLPSSLRPLCSPCAACCASLAAVPPYSLHALCRLLCACSLHGHLVPTS